MGFTPSAGEELQSEYLVAREQAGAAIEAVRALADRIRPVLHVCEIRTVAADRLWMSPQYGRDSVGIHFTWALEPEAVLRRARRPRAGARAVRPAPALGQALPARAALRAPARLRAPRRARSIRAARSGTRGSKPGYWVLDDPHDLRHHRHRLALGVLPPPRARGARSPPRRPASSAAPPSAAPRSPRAGARPRSSRSRRCCARRRPTSSSRASRGRRCPTPRARWSGSARASSPRRRPRRTCPACGRSGPTSATAASSRSPSSTC